MSSGGCTSRSTLACGVKLRQPQAINTKSRTPKSAPAARILFLAMFTGRSILPLAAGDEVSAPPHTLVAPQDVAPAEGFGVGPRSNESKNLRTGREGGLYFRN